MDSVVFYYTLISLASVVSLLMALMVCVCRRFKSSSNGVNNIPHNNSNSLLPLNSIRSSDLTNNSLQLMRYNINGNNGFNTIAVEETDNHLRHNKQMTLNRALPDIPSVLSSSVDLSPNEFALNSDNNESNESQHKSEPSRRSAKARAPQPPNNRLNGYEEGLAGVSTTVAVDAHHPYARIKDNAVLDSSTENDTDDYCDPQLCQSSNNQFMARNTTESIDNNDMSPPVPVKRFGSNDVSSDCIASNVIPNRVPSEEMPYMTAPQVRQSNVETISQSSNDERGVNATKNEINYNTISVREPLAKVLAERANSEHHYNEVEDERVSSFYEEIPGSTASSVTYSKIGDIVLSNNNNSIQNSNEDQQHISIDCEPPTLPSLESLMQARAESSCSASPQLSIASNEPNTETTFMNNYPKDLYSSVDKKSKSYNRQTIHCVPDLDNEFDNLYAKVQKVQTMAKVDAVNANQRPSSAAEDRCDSYFMDPHLNTLPDNGIPPPLPPPLNKSFHPRSSRTISMYDSSNIVPNTNPYSHQRRYSSGTQTINTNNSSEWRKEQINDYFNYQTVRNNDVDLESDPGYEVIKKKTQMANLPSHSEVSTTNIANGYLLQPSIPAVEMGYEAYEAIGFDETDFDPAYETITKKVVTNDSIEIIEPGYEVIKRVPKKQSSPHFERNITRNVSDVSSEPGYERIRFTQKSEDEIESEPKYASISRTVDFYEDEEEEEQITERL